jgi:hypothetical protein
MMWRALIVFLLAAGTTLACWFSPPPRGGIEAGVVMHLPARVGLLAGTQREPDKTEMEVLPTDTQFAKMTYVTATQDAAERDVAHVSVVLSGAESRSIHRPEVCLTGQGWTVTGSQVVPVQIAPGRTLLVKDLAISGTFPANNGKARQLKAHYVYWFTGTDVTTPSHFTRLWRSTWDAVLHNVNHRWAYASVMACVTEDMDPAECGERRRTDEQTRRLISYLIQQLVPQFQKEFMSPAPPQS